MNRRSQGCAICALCILLIASQTWTILPLERYVSSLFSMDRGRHRNKNLGYTASHSAKKPVFNAQEVRDVGVVSVSALLDEQEMQLLSGIVRDWEAFRKDLYGGLDDDLLHRLCFLWIRDCYNLAKHKTITEAVESVLGYPVLLFGLSVINMPPQSEGIIKLKYEGFQCETVDVLINSGVHLIQNSHKMTAKMALGIASQIRAIHRVYGNDESSIKKRIESAAVVHLSDKVPGISTGDMGIGGYIINGRMLYATSNPTDSIQTSILLQYIPANCTLRYQQPDDTKLAFVTKPILPPTLIASSGISEIGGLGKDVRGKLVQNEVIKYTQFVDEREYWLLRTLPNSTITVFRRQHASGYARSLLLDRIIVEKVFTQETRINFMSFTEDQVVIVARGCLIHHLAREGYREARELKNGDLTYLSSSDLHALVAVPYAEIIFVRWKLVNFTQPIVNQKSLSQAVVNTVNFSQPRKSISNGKHLFEMPANGLGAVNAKAMVLKSGQAYDPENEGDCDVLVVVIKGFNLQILPLQEFIGVNEAVLVPARESCILWNSGALPLTIAAIQLYRRLHVSFDSEKDAYMLEAAYRTRGKVM